MSGGERLAAHNEGGTLDVSRRKYDKHFLSQGILGRWKYSVNDLVTETEIREAIQDRQGHHTGTRCTGNYERSELRCEEVSFQKILICGFIFYEFF